MADHPESARDRELDEEREAEIDELVGRLDALAPSEGAHLTIPADAEGRTSAGNRLGYLRLGVEFLVAALHPVPAGEDAPAQVVPQLGRLLRRGHGLAERLLAGRQRHRVGRGRAGRPAGGGISGWLPLCRHVPAVTLLGDAEELPRRRWRLLRLGSAEAEVAQAPHTIVLGRAS